MQDIEPSPHGAVKATDAEQIDAVRSYYDQTRLDYWWLWFTRGDQSIHFGYRDTNAKTHRSSVLNMNRVLAERAGVTEGTTVLDAGCGVGSTSRFLARTYGAKVIGITPVPSQVARARKLNARSGLDGLVHTEQGDYLATGFDDDAFDVVIAQESICHSADKKSFLREAFRVLRPGGRLVIAEYFLFPRPFSPDEQALMESWWSGWAIPDLAVGDKFNDWARDTGFEEVVMDDVTANVRHSLRRLYRITMTFYPGELLLRAVRLRSKVQHGNVVASRDQWRSLKRDLWFYGIFSATKPNS